MESVMAWVRQLKFAPLPRRVVGHGSLSLQTTFVIQDLTDASVHRLPQTVQERTAVRAAPVPIT
jgi:hypothetical protein